MVFQLQTNSPSKLKKSWFFKNIFFLYEFLSKIQIGFDYHRTWWYQFFRYFLCKIFSPEISCDFDLSTSRSSLRSLAWNMKRYMVLVVPTYIINYTVQKGYLAMLMVSFLTKLIVANTYKAFHFQSIWQQKLIYDPFFRLWKKHVLGEKPI